jgi:hypothetical protein
MGEPAAQDRFFGRSNQLDAPAGTLAQAFLRPHEGVITERLIAKR